MVQDEKTGGFRMTVDRIDRIDGRPWIILSGRDIEGSLGSGDLMNIVYQGALVHDVEVRTIELHMPPGIVAFAVDQSYADRIGVGAVCESMGPEFSPKSDTSKLKAIFIILKDSLSPTQAEVVRSALNLKRHGRLTDPHDELMGSRRYLTDRRRLDVSLVRQEVDGACYISLITSTEFSTDDLLKLESEYISALAGAQIDIKNVNRGLD